jgi:hypothetical protein
VNIIPLYHQAKAISAARGFRPTPARAQADVQLCKLRAQRVAD